MKSKIGITGGIGSGKTIVATIFKTMGIPIYDSDSKAKQLMEKSPTIKEKLILLIGEEVYSNQKINKELVTKYLFSASHNRERINQIVHPEVFSDFQKWTMEQESPIVGIESAILFESKLNKLVDYTVTVFTPLDVRIERICKRDGISKDKAQTKIASQLNEEYKLAHSDFIIQNNDQQPLIPQVAKIISTITK